MRAIAGLLLLLIGTYAHAQVKCSIAASAFLEASKVRGLSKKKEVPCEVKNKEEVKKFLVHSIDTDLPDGKLQNEELVYKGVGILPFSFKYKEGMVELLVSQLGGYYDPKREHYVMAGWMPEILQTPIAVHELTHALQDQYYNLDQFISPQFTTDQVMARQALVEGDATAVMTDYSLLQVGSRGLRYEDNVESMMMQNVLSMGLMGNANVPEPLKLALLFPYTSGLRFVHTLLKIGGYKEVDKAFKNPPQSTSEILHPEKYINHSKQSVEIDLHPLIPETEGTIFYEDSLGEFTIASLFKNDMTQRENASRIGNGWLADKVALIRRKDSEQISILWKTVWESPKEAEEFFNAYKPYITSLYRSLNRAVDLQLTEDTVLFNSY